MTTNPIIKFNVVGVPKGQPRPRAFAFHGRARIYDPGTAEGWKSEIARAAKHHLPKEPLEGPLRVSIEFRFPRPKSHFRKVKGQGVLKDDAAVFHAGKPDADNAAKAVLDAMTTLGFWKDDSQVAILSLAKTYAAPGLLLPGATITIHVLGKTEETK